jgi:peptidoglycan/LPS O-acetylase OafA/YrhL
LEHFGGAIQLIGGWRAVQVFYYISGFYMALILGEKYRNSTAGVFLRNRFLRIFPIYYISIFLVVLRGIYAHLNHVPCQYYVPHCGQIRWENWRLPLFLIFTQLGILGQDWLFFFRIDPQGWVHFTKEGLTEPLQAYAFNINPVSWTLGLEISFYLMAPFLLKRSNFCLLVLSALSLSLRAIGYFKFGLNSLIWNYRFFPFELSVFLLGGLSYRWYNSVSGGYPRQSPQLMKGLLGLSIFSTSFFSYFEKWFNFPTLAYYSIIAFSIPAVFHVSKDNKLDRRIGDLSFPIYLIHLPLLSLSKRFLSSDPIISVLLVLLVAYLLDKFVTQPIDQLRQRLITKKI